MSVRVRALKGGGILAFTLFLAACQTTAQQGAAPASHSIEPLVSQAVDSETESVSEIPEATVAEDGSAEETATQEAALPAADPPQEDLEPEEIEVDADPERFLGLDLVALKAELGPPRLEREEDPARIWQYRDATCVLDLYLYEEAGQYRVTYLEARDPEAQPFPTENCLRPLLQARAKALTG